MLILRFTVIVLLLVERFYILFQQQQQQAGDGTFLWRHDVREQISVHAGSFFGSCVHSLESALLTMRFSGGSCEEFMYVRTLQCVVYNSTGSNSPRRRQPAAEEHAQPLQHSRRCLLLRVLGDGGRDASSIGGGPGGRLFRFSPPRM